MDEKEKLKLITRVGTVFSPGAPIDQYALFAGRTEQVRDVIGAVSQRGQHVIIFGERGVGKTSLANVLSELLSEAGLQGIASGRVNCDGTDDFSSLWHKVFREISVVKQIREIGFGKKQTDRKTSLESLLPDTVVPDDIRFILSRLKTSAIIIIDEIDRIKNREVTTLFADTIKTLSDHSVDATLILVGVADTVDELITEHRSIERALVQIRMPRMSRVELFEILDKGFGKMKMTIDDKARNQIATLSQGLPHYTHLLSLHVAQTAIDNDRTNVTTDDLATAICLAVDKAQQSILSAYHKAVSSARKTLYSEVLLACALAQTDDLGYFAANDIRDPMTRIMDKPYDIPAFSRHLNDFCENKRGPVLQKTGSARRFRFRFINPLMQPFIILHGLAKGLIDKDVLVVPA